VSADLRPLWQADPFAQHSATQLVQDACNLKVLSYKFALLGVSSEVLGRDKLACRIEAQTALDAFVASFANLRAPWHQCDMGEGHVAPQAQICPPETEAILTEFERMARHICAAFEQGDPPDPAELSDLVRFVAGPLCDANTAILEAANCIALATRTDTEKIALTDLRTGLPNSHALKNELARKDSKGGCDAAVARIHIDMTAFRDAHRGADMTAKDAALKHAATAITSVMTEDDFLARVDRDLFALVLYGAQSEDALERRADVIIEALSAPFVFEGKMHQLRPSIGLSLKDKTDDVDLSRCMTNADLALYHAKTAGRAAFRFFTPFLQTQREQKEKLHAQIRIGMDTQQFEPFFQPQVEGRTGKIVGFESLARWHHPTRGLLAPINFLDAAQDAGLLKELDEYLMARTLASMRRWLDDGLAIPQVSLNLTGSRLLETNLVETMLFAADKSNLASSMIGIEILESAMIDNDSKQMMDNITGLAQAGFKLELDDFGTGHASISNLKNFKVDRIKIDRSFVKDIHLYPELSKITGAMIGLAHALRVDALAEGVETPEERLVLNALGCDHFQGYGISRPMPGSEIPRWFKRTQSKTMLIAARA